jgi:hypothetical protein
MQAILLAIRHVVDQVDDAGEDAEDAERGERLADGLGHEERRRRRLLPEEQRGEDDQVLGPLRRAQGHEEAQRRGALAGRLGRDG